MTRLEDLEKIKELTLREDKGDIEALKLVKGYNDNYCKNNEGYITALSLSKSPLESLELTDADKALKYLYLSGNQSLKKVTLVSLPKLTHLYLDNCALEEITIPAGCNELKQIYLQKNQLKKIVFEGDCSELELVDLSGNELTEFNLPVIFENMQYLYLEGNDSIANIPKEVYQGKTNSWEDVRNYLDSGDKKEYLHEAKMILIGNGEVGKSSIRIKLLDEKAPLPKIEDRTQGLHAIIENYWIKQLNKRLTNLKKNIDFKLNIWDFGGQGRYREVQALFCSRKSLYIFVTSPDDKAEKEDYVGYEYWLSMANAFSQEQTGNETRLSPVIYVMNKIDAESGNKTIQEGDIKKQFGNVEDFIKISCLTLHNFSELKTAIQANLPKIGTDIFTDKYAANWLQVKKKLEEKAKKGVNYISNNEFLTICAKEGMNPSESETWLSVLDRIGTVMYFSKHYSHENLKDFIVLNPAWVRDAVCKVLDANFIEDGKLYPSHFPIVWNEYNATESFLEKVKSIFTSKKYTQAEHEKLLALMLAYKLCYPQKDQFNKPFYVVPSLLKNEKPNLSPALQKFDYEIRFNYEPFIPAGTLNKLIVELNILIYNDLKWKNGVILHDIEAGAFAQVTESWEEKKVYIKLKGSNIQSLYGRIFNTLQDLVQDLKNAKLLNHLSFSIEGYENGVWTPDALLKNYKVKKFSFLWEDNKERGIGYPEPRPKKKKTSNMIEVTMQKGAKTFAPFNQIEGQIKILSLSANPDDTKWLRLDREGKKAKLEQRLSADRDKFIIIDEQAITLKDMQRAIVTHQPHVIHYSGHGDKKSIYLEDQEVTTDLLVKLFQLAKKTQLVILNACDSFAHTEKIAQYIPYVIGNDGEIDDDSAIEFSEGFYMSFFAFNSIEDAVENGRLSIQIADLPDSDLPILVKGTPQP